MRKTLTFFVPKRRDVFTGSDPGLIDSVPDYTLILVAAHVVGWSIHRDHANQTHPRSNTGFIKIELTNGQTKVVPLTPAHLNELEELS